MYGVGRLVCRRTTEEELRIHLSCEGDDESCNYKIESRLLTSSYCILEKKAMRHLRERQQIKSNLERQNHLMNYMMDKVVCILLKTIYKFSTIHGLQNLFLAIWVVILNEHRK